MFACETRQCQLLSLRGSWPLALARTPRAAEWPGSMRGWRREIQRDVSTLAAARAMTTDALTNTKVGTVTEIIYSPRGITAAGVS